jgi:hypothetical protein
MEQTDNNNQIIPIGRLASALWELSQWLKRKSLENQPADELPAAALGQYYGPPGLRAGLQWKLSQWVERKSLESTYGRTKQEVIHNVLITMGFDGPPFDINEIYEPGTYHVRRYNNENSHALNCVTVFPNYVHLKMYSKNAAFADSGTIGPPLPNARDLISFVYSEGYFVDE